MEYVIVTISVSYSIESGEMILYSQTCWCKAMVRSVFAVHILIMVLIYQDIL